MFQRKRKDLVVAASPAGARRATGGLKGESAAPAPRPGGPMMEPRAIREAIGRLVGGGSLSEEEAASAMDEIMTGVATPSQLGAFLTALRIKGETIEEITGLARAMRAHAVHVALADSISA